MLVHAEKIQDRIQTKNTGKKETKHDPDKAKRHKNTAEQN